MKRFTQTVILLLVTTFLPVLVLFTFSAGGAHASTHKSSPTPTPTPSLTPSPTPPSTGSWTVTGSLHVARADFTATLLTDGQVLVVGGRDTTYTPLASAELYNPATGTWTTTGSLHTARVQHTATLLQNGQVLVAAGQNGTNNLPSTDRAHTP